MKKLMIMGAGIYQVPLIKMSKGNGHLYDCGQHSGQLSGLCTRRSGLLREYRGL